MSTRALFAYAFAIAGCTTPANNNKNDLSMNGNDMAMTTNHDFAVTSYFDTSSHDIDTASPTDPNLASNKPVRLTGVIAIAPVSRFLSHPKSGGAVCMYSVDVSDPSCVTPPCGMVVTGNAGMTFATQDLGSSACPLPDASGTILANVVIGSQLTVQGRVDTFPDKNNAFIIQHSIQADTVTITGTGTVTPIPLDVASVSFLTDMPSGAGGDWMMYEGTYVKLAPASGKMTITYGTGTSQYDFTIAPGNAHFGTSYYFNFGNHDLAGGGQYPAGGSQWSSLSGVVETIFGGTVQPTQASDFVP